ncbi:shewanella-like protein phosphatase 2 [Nymphaea colorata]|uniref:Calcineurin-like phosphoesterase domain-containing protein n=1 Tax=Nymphaea colorata TaxID=210225 RepID=A0A5K1B376_9MAGN|nr:shewanella-like protein phosphatase 2 [Nymphaea colorata]
MNSMDAVCDDLPAEISSFVDTFVDFVVGGVFLKRESSEPDCRDQQQQHQRQQEQPSAPRTTYPQPGRLVAVGDIHGDLQKAKQSLRIAKIIDENDRWIGGNTMVVQVGDILDRGGEELKILYFLEKLKQEASKSGGDLIVMNGNHEIMNMSRDFRYVTKAGFKEFENWADWFNVGVHIKKLCNVLDDKFDAFRGIPTNLNRESRARIAALRPGGPISTRFLASNPTILVVGDSVFVHSGVLPGHVEYGLERINKEVGEWIRGTQGDSKPPSCVRGRDSVVWLRRYSTKSVGDGDCSVLQHALETIPNAKRMIVGHTIQESGINGACQNRVIRIDVGMSKGCGNGMPEVLEITRNKGVRILTSNPLYNQAMAADDKVGLGLLVPDGPRKEVEVNA